MFHSIGNKIGMSYVITFWDERLQKAPPTKCVIEALELCFNCNNLVFNNTNYIHTDGKTQGPHVLCSYSDIVMRAHSSETLVYDFHPNVWNRFRNNVFLIWLHDTAKSPSFLNYLTNDTGKTEFIMRIVNQKIGLEFYYLKVKCINGNAYKKE